MWPWNVVIIYDKNVEFSIKFFALEEKCDLKSLTFRVMDFDIFSNFL